MKRVVILLSIFLLVGCDGSEKKKENGKGLEKEVKKTGQEIKQKYESKGLIRKKKDLVIEKIKNELLPSTPENIKEFLIDSVKSYVKGWSHHIIKNKRMVNKLNSYFVGEQWRCIWKGDFNYDKRIDYFVVVRDKRYYRAITKGIILGAKGEHILEINLGRGFFNKKGDVLNLSQIGILGGEFRSIRMTPGFEQFENIDSSPIFLLSYEFIDKDGFSVFSDGELGSQDLEINPKKYSQENRGNNYYKISSPTQPLEMTISFLVNKVKKYRKNKNAGKAIKAFNMSPYPKDYKDIANIK